MSRVTSIWQKHTKKQLHHKLKVEAFLNRRHPFAKIQHKASNQSRDKERVVDLDCLNSEKHREENLPGRIAICFNGRNSSGVEKGIFPKGHCP